MPIPNDYFFIGKHDRAFSPAVYFYYSPVKMRAWCVFWRGEVEYFDTLRSCVDYSVNHRMIREKDVQRITENLKAEADRIEAAEWCKG